MPVAVRMSSMLNSSPSLNISNTSVWNSETCSSFLPCRTKWSVKCSRDVMCDANKYGHASLSLLSMLPPLWTPPLVQRDPVWAATAASCHCASPGKTAWTPPGVLPSAKTQILHLFRDYAHSYGSVNDPSRMRQAIQDSEPSSNILTTSPPQIIIQLRKWTETKALTSGGKWTSMGVYEGQ